MNGSAGFSCVTLIAQLHQPSSGKRGGLGSGIAVWEDEGGAPPAPLELTGALRVRWKRLGVSGSASNLNSSPWPKNPE